MTRTRGPELSKEFHDYIFEQWTYFGKNATQICRQVNTDSELLSKFGKTSVPGIHYHIVRINEELENTIGEDALDTYIGKFIRAEKSLETDEEAIDHLIENEMKVEEDKRNVDLILRLRRFKHEVKIDKFKLLQDSALPLQVKKLKIEREKYRPKVDVVKQVEGVSELRDTPDTQ